MSMNDSLVVAATTVKDSVVTLADASTVQSAATAVSQTALGAAAEAAKAAGFSVQPTFGQVVEFQLTGLLVVFTVLGGLTLMCYMLGWILKAVAPDQYYGKSRPSAPAAAPAAVKPAAPAPAVASVAPAVASSIHPGLSDDELIAILAVAASEGMGRPVSIVKFRSQDSMDWTWSVQGRVGLHSSHKL